MGRKLVATKLVKDPVSGDPWSEFRRLLPLSTFLAPCRSIKKYNDKVNNLSICIRK